MKNILFLAVLFAAPLAMIAQEETPKDSIPNGWTRAGNLSLLFNQAAFNHEWTGGGTSNYSGNLSLTYDFNYKHDKISWNNRLTGEYGLTRNKDDKFSRKTNDRLELNSILGQQIKESNWYYSLFFNFIRILTQTTKGIVQKRLTFYLLPIFSLDLVCYGKKATICL